MIYRRQELNCIQCHAVSGAGGNVGPDLSGIGVNSPTEYLLDSILLPSATIKEAYLTRQVLTGDGVVVRGVQIDRDDQRLILRDENGREVVIPIDDIEQESEGKSLMPEGLHQLLTQAELVDLVAFLGALGKPGEFAVHSRPTINRWDALVEIPSGIRWGELTDPQFAGQFESLPDAAWQGVYSLVDGSIPADAIPAQFRERSVGPALLRGQIEVVVAGPIGVRVDGASDARVVIDGRRVEPDGAIELKPGRYPVYLLISDPADVQSLTTEVTKPSGSPAQVTVLGGK